MDGFDSDTALNNIAQLFTRASTGNFSDAVKVGTDIKNYLEQIYNDGYKSGFDACTNAQEIIKNIIPNGKNNNPETPG